MALLTTQTFHKSLTQIRERLRILSRLPLPLASTDVSLERRVATRVVSALGAIILDDWRNNERLYGAVITSTLRRYCCRLPITRLL